MSLPEKVRHFMVIGFVILILAGGVTFVVIMKEKSDKLIEESANVTVTTSNVTSSTTRSDTFTDSTSEISTESTETTKSTTSITFSSTTSTNYTSSTSVLSEYSLKDSLDKQFEMTSGLIRVPMIRKLF